MIVSRVGKSLVAGLTLSTLIFSNSFAGFKDISKRNENRFDITKAKVDPNRDNIILSFVDEVMLPGTYATVYPWPLAPKPAMSDLESFESGYSLEVELKADAWSGGAICMGSGIDLTEYYEKGALEFVIKGTLDREVLEVGLLDDGSNSKGHPLRVYGNTRSYSIISNKEWTKITIPFTHFGKVGSYWDEQVGARLSFPFNWNSTTCFGFDLFKNQFPKFNVFFDNVRLIKSYESTGPKVDGYPLRNEGY